MSARGKAVQGSNQRARAVGIPGLQAGEDVKSKPTLLLDDMRKEFATFLSADTTGRWRMDAALAHVVKLAFESGIAAGKASMSGHINDLETENLDMRARLDKVRILNILNQHAAPGEANTAANRIIDGLRIRVRSRT